MTRRVGRSAGRETETETYSLESIEPCNSLWGEFPEREPEMPRLNLPPLNKSLRKFSGSGPGLGERCGVDGTESDGGYAAVDSSESDGEYGLLGGP